MHRDTFRHRLNRILKASIVCILAMSSSGCPAQHNPSPSKADNPPAKSAEIAPEIIAAWEKAGAKFGWLPTEGELYIQFARPADRASLPCLDFSNMSLPVAEELPIPTVPFALFATSSSRKSNSSFAKGDYVKHLPGRRQAAALVLFSVPWADTDIAEVAQLKQLRHLAITIMGISDDRVQQLKDLTQLTSLDLNSTAITDRSLPTIARFENLTSLNIGYNKNITDGGIALLGRLKKLKHLDLSDIEFTDAVFKSLAAFPELESLNLTDTKIQGRGLKNLAQLRSLRLSGSEVSDATMSELSALANLRTLDLTDSAVTGVGLRKLAALDKLERLVLNAKVVAADDVEPILAAAKGLRFFYVPLRPADPAGLARLKKAYPQVNFNQ